MGGCHLDNLQFEIYRKPVAFDHVFRPCRDLNLVGQARFFTILARLQDFAIRLRRTIEMIANGEFGSGRLLSSGRSAKGSPGPLRAGRLIRTRECREGCLDGRWDLGTDHGQMVDPHGAAKVLRTTVETTVLAGLEEDVFVFFNGRDVPGKGFLDGLWLEGLGGEITVRNGEFQVEGCTCRRGESER